MAAFQIVEVCTEDSVSGTHEHIAYVKLSHGTVLPRSTVVDDIRSGRDSYYTLVDGNQADVIVVECPICTFGDYIKTEADSTTADNLLSLPRFYV